MSGTTKVTQTVQALLRAVIKRTIQPGQWLPGADSVARALGVSRATVREAFASLDARGALYIEPWDGTQVKDPVDDGHLSLISDLLEVMEPENRARLLKSVLRLRLWLWTEVAGRAATDRPTASIELLMRSCEELEGLVMLQSSENDLRNEDVRFRRLVAMSCDPLATTMLMNTIEAITDAEYRGVICEPISWQERHEWMKAMTEAIAQKDGARARSLMSTRITSQHERWAAGYRPDPIPLEDRLRRPARPNVLEGLFS